MIKNIDVTPGINKKLLLKYKSPYEINEVLDFDRYVIADMDGFQLTQKPSTTTVGPNRMKLWTQK